MKTPTRFWFVAFILIVSVFVLHLVNVNAQTNDTSQPQLNQSAGYLQDRQVERELLTNYARSHGLTPRDVVNNPKYYMDYETNVFFQIHGMTESEYMSNVVHNWKPTQPWPEPSKRREIFVRCAEVLRSAVDTNQLEWVCSNMSTNLPALRKFQNQSTKDGPITITFVTNEIVISHFRDFSRQTMLNLDGFADLLGSPDLESYIGPGYCAKIINSKNYFFWLFWPNNLVRSIEKRTVDGQHVILRASFYEDGKLGGFRVTSPPESITFDENGKLISYNGRNNNMAIELRPDENGNIKVRGFIFKQ